MGRRSTPSNRRPIPAPSPGLGLEELVARLQDLRGLSSAERQKIIPEGMSFLDWVEGLCEPKDGSAGLRVDGKPFRLDNRPAMRWIYEQIPSTEKEAYQHQLVVMKCAQVGFTVMEMLAAIYLGLRFAPSTVGMFLPDVALTGKKSTERFMPIVRSVPQVHALMTQDDLDGGGRRAGEGNVGARRIHESLFLFGWTSGRASTESMPMDVLSFDEVQEISLQQIEKTMERMSASPIRYCLMGSTANWPESDIHFHYLKGTQHRFHTRCRVCNSLEPLDEYFPACIRWDPDAIDPVTERLGSHRYVCPEGHWIDDPQDGEWIAKFPDNWVTSCHFPQFLSPTISANEIMRKFTESTDKKNFYNRVLGKPFLDPAQVPVNLAHMAACVAAGKAAGLKWKAGARHTFMGIDQMGNFNVVMIKERLPDGRQGVVHMEEVYHADPFMRCSELMDQYGVDVCVVEINPNYNDAKRFSGRHPGRVFICDSFGSLPDDMLKWGDAPKLDTSEKRTDAEERDRWTVRVDQYKTMQVAMARFTANPPLCLFPDDQELFQDVDEGGRMQRAAVAPRAFFQFTKTALVVEKRDEEGGTNAYKRVVRKISIDPHWSYANQLCEVAWARSHGSAIIWVPQTTVAAGALGVKETASMVEAVNRNMPGLPVSVLSMLNEGDRNRGELCGKCTAYPLDTDGKTPSRSTCEERRLLVMASDPACPLYVEAMQTYG